MEKQHLTYFKIENFKRFDSFEMSNLGQFNLIVGDNNVGKTSVLEALTFDENLLKLASNFLGFLNFRTSFQFESEGLMTIQEVQATKFWSLIFKDYNKPITFTIDGYLQTSLILNLKAHLEGVELTMAQSKVSAFVPNLWLKLSDIRHKSDTFQIMGAYFEDTGFNDKDNYMPYIPVNLGYRNDLIDFFYSYFNSDKEARRELENNLKLFIPNVEEIRVHKFSQNGESLGVTLIDNNSIFPLTQFGDGTIKIVRILFETLVAQNRRLMIDEIGSGIHFTRLKDYWKIILQLCSKHNVQLFATTHSLECQQAFIEALEDEVMRPFKADARNISLVENKQGEVKAITYDFDQFEYAMNIGFNTRGGVL